MRKILLFFLLLAGKALHSQSYNNGWINYNATYYKFKIGTTGLYRITQPALASLGIANIPAGHFQLWRNGLQVPIYTSVQTGVLAPGDYIEFWGEMNDGKPDKDLYSNSDFQLSDKLSLETDTATFFLTINPSGANLHYSNTSYALPSALQPEPYFIHTLGAYYNNRINRGPANNTYTEYLYLSTYEAAEGWASTEFAGGESLSKSFTSLYPANATGMPNPVLRIHACGSAFNPRQFEASVNSTVAGTETMNSFEYKKSNFSFSPSLINSGAAVIRIKNLCAASNDRMSVSKAELIYAREFNFGGATNFEFELPANAAGNYLEISGFNHGGVAPVLYDITNQKRYVADISNTALVKVELQPSSVNRKLVLVSQAASYPQNITSFQQRNFSNYSLPANQGDYLIITHSLLTSGPSGSNPAEDYKAYRSSAAGGSHNAKIYFIDELTDQFGLGIKNNPLAIRNFIRWARNNFSAPVKNVLLLGKGVQYPTARQYESHPDISKLALIPTFGEPPSDNLLAAEPGANELPNVSIGRISAINAQEAAEYLSKVKQYEQNQALQSPLIADKAWLKNVMHLMGPGSEAEYNAFSAYMGQFKKIISDTLYGAGVNTFGKLTTAPVEPASNQKIYELFEKGTGLITYLGHSSAATLEFNLDNPSNYNNPGKYPIITILGCNAGNFFNFNPGRFTSKETISEKFVLANQRGSIAFVASTHFSTTDFLYLMNSSTYTAAGVTQYGKSLGEILRETLNKTINNPLVDNYFARMHCAQQTLHGDPALKIGGAATKADYAIEDNLLKVTPAFVSVAENRFKIDAKFMNIGKAINKNIVVELKRTFPDNSTVTLRRDTIPGIRYIDSLNYEFDIVATRDKGLNKISLCLDADNTVDELFESNNCITKEVYIYEDEARPAYPYPFAIVNNPAITLKASTANPFSTARQYLMEIDTSEYFNSPSKISRSITSAGGVIEFSPGLSFTDSTVYYWRVAYAPASGQPVWNRSSFIYLSNSGPNSSDPGFNQSHFFQHTNSLYERLTLDSASRQLKYNPINQELFIKIGTFVTSSAQQGDFIVSVNGSSYIRLTNWFQSLVFNVFDPVNFKPWQNQVIVPATNLPFQLGNGKYKSLSPQSHINGFVTPYNFEYRYTDSLYRKNAMNFMKDTIPDGHYVVVRNFSLDRNTFPDTVTFPQVFISKWQEDQTHYGTGVSLYHYLKNAGFAGIDSFYRTRPWVFVYKKNDASFTPQWFVGDNTSSNYTFTVHCPTPDTLGYVTSPVFGPARTWKQLKWRGSTDQISGDSTSVDLIGITGSGAEAVLFSGLTTAQQNLDVSSINAATYPFVKLRMRTFDTTMFTPYQLSYWRITYTPIPEGAMAPNLYLKVKDSIEAGEPMDYKIAFRNISDAAFDSLKVKMIITDRNNLRHIVPLPRKRPLPAFGNTNDTVHIGTIINSAALSGLNTVYIEANPDNDQPEQFHFNNFAYRNLYVKPDSLNPLLDVTFDGEHILNKDIVSAKPEILIKLKDESKWMVLDDTSLLTINIKDPDGETKRFFFNSSTLQFTPAGSPPNTDNTASALLTPVFTKDGEYLLTVTGKDKTDNPAGIISYRISFLVYNKPMISNMLNYPNPFTTSTAFVFTLTGSEVPQNLKIEIMTITGKVVREITKEELGPLHIGRNITEYKWDGTDQYGQKLANGVYLYRVVTNLNGSRLEKFTENGDKTEKFFTRGWGKMYLMR